MSVANWQWLFDAKRQRLQLAMDDVTLDIRYPRRLLQMNLPEVSAFDVEDASHFNHIRDYLDSYSHFNVSEQLQACIHATAALHFMKPSLPQSWHFRFNELIEGWPTKHQACTLDSGLDCCEFLILEQDERTSLCLLLDAKMRLSPTKEMQQFECIRVLNDRLHESKSHPLPQQWSDDWSSLA